jgi:4-hydroxy 2-oxovalerate aldolase
LLYLHAVRGNIVSVFPGLTRGQTDAPPLLLDVTLRDGGYVNGHSWTTNDALSVVQTMEAANIPFTEVGYLRTPSGNPMNPSARCEPDYLRALAAPLTDTRLAVMVRPGEVSAERIAGLKGLGVGMVRILAKVHDIRSTAPYIEAALAEGLTVAVNLTHASKFSPDEIGAAAAGSAEAGAGIVYLADSNGSLFPDEVAARVAAAVEAVGAGIQQAVIGFHPHDNLGLAFANTCAALAAGARAIDASMAGIGKGGGNLRLELIAAHLAVRFGAGYLLDPLILDRSATAARLRMLADGAENSLVSGLLDVSLDQSQKFREQVARDGYDNVLRNGRKNQPVKTNP